MAYDQELARRIRSLLKEVPGWEEKKMFGGTGYMVNGHLACGVHGDQIIVRMSETDYAEALTQPQVHVFDLTGRPMKGWVTVEPSGVAKESDLKFWIERGLRYAQGLPPK